MYFVYDVQRKIITIGLVAWLFFLINSLKVGAEEGDYLYNTVSFNRPAFESQSRSETMKLPPLKSRLSTAQKRS